MVDTPRKTFPELQALSAPVVDSDLLAVYRSPGPVKRTTASVLKTYAQTGVALSATLAASSGAALIGSINSGTGAVARTLQGRAQDLPTLFDFIPVAEHAAIIARTSTYDCSAAIAAAHAACDHVIVTEGRYIIGAMVELGLGGVGQRGFECQAGVEFARTDTAITTPLFWLKADDVFLIGANLSSCRISTAARCPDGIVLIGHRDMATSHANLNNCRLSGFRISGPINYGQTTGNPDVAVKLCNPQLSGLASYFHRVENIRAQAVNYGFHLQGFANGNFLNNLEGWYIGNGTLSSHRAFMFFDGAQQNQLFGCFFHFSPGSTCWKFRDYDNTGVPGGFNHVCLLNTLDGQCEQDPTPSGGIGIDAPDVGCTGSVNSLILRDNCPSNNIGTTFALNNTVSILSRMTFYGGLTATSEIRAPGALRMESSPLYLANIGDSNWQIAYKVSPNAAGFVAANVEVLFAGGANYGKALVGSDNTLYWSVDANGDQYVAGNTNVASGKVYKVAGTQVVGARGSAVADATDAASVIARLNDLLARCRAHGLIAT
jgi:hypothetical protein